MPCDFRPLLKIPKCSLFCREFSAFSLIIMWINLACFSRVVILNPHLFTLFSVRSSETAKLPLIHCNFHRTVLVVIIESPSWVLTSNWLLQVRLLNLINISETFFNNLFSFPFAGTNDPVLTVIKFLVNLSSLWSLFGSLWNNNNSRICFKLKCHFYSGH